MKRLPTRIRLPFHYTIKVVSLSDKAMLVEQEEDDKNELVDGLWDVEQRTIFVRKSLAFARKAEVLGHELDHAVNDWRHWVRDSS